MTEKQSCIRFYPRFILFPDHRFDRLLDCHSTMSHGQSDISWFFFSIGLLSQLVLVLLCRIMVLLLVRAVAAMARGELCTED